MGGRGDVRQLELPNYEHPATSTHLAFDKRAPTPPAQFFQTPTEDEHGCHRTHSLAVLAEPAKQILRNGGSYWYLLLFVGICWHVLIFVSICWYVLVWYLLVFVDIY